MPHSPTHSRSSSAAASVAYGMGSTHPYDNPSSPPLSSCSSSPASDSPIKSNSKLKLKPSERYNSYSDFADLPGPQAPPPNRGANLDISRFASFERKAEALAYTEQLLLDWLRDQARYTLPPDVNLAELNLASRILYRLTAIQKTMLSIDAILVAQRNNQPVPPIDDDPLPPPDEGDDDPEPPLGARASTPATPLPVTSHEHPSANPLGPRTASSADAPACNTPTPSQPLTPTPPPTDVPSPRSDLPAPHSSEIPKSEIHNPHSARAASARAASVRTCPTLPLNRLERAFTLNENNISSLTGVAFNAPSSQIDLSAAAPDTTLPAPALSAPPQAPSSITPLPAPPPHSSADSISTNFPVPHSTAPP